MRTLTARSAPPRVPSLLTVGALAVTAGLLVVPSARAAGLAAGCAQAGVGAPVVCTFASTGAEQAFAVPAAVTTLSVKAVGGAGGAAIPVGSVPAVAGGMAAGVSGTVTVTAGSTLYVEVGAPGKAGSSTGDLSAAGGFGGGGTGQGQAGGGGGASDVRTVPAAGTSSLSSRLAVAAGGGGSAPAQASPAGMGGGAGSPGTAGAGDTTPAGGGGAGSATAGGAGGSPGRSTAVVFGTSVPITGDAGQAGGSGVGGGGGATGGNAQGGGGGGGGLFGGGGGGGPSQTSSSTTAGGGGGGSSLVPMGGTSAVSAAAPGVVISYTPVGPATGGFAISPPTSTIPAGTTQTYATTGTGADGGAVVATAATTFTIRPDGSCSGAVCTATVGGPHTVTGTDGALTATATLMVTPLAAGQTPSPAGVVVTLSGVTFTTFGRHVIEDATVTRAGAPVVGASVLFSEAYVDGGGGNISVATTDATGHARLSFAPLYNGTIKAESLGASATQPSRVVLTYARATATASRAVVLVSAATGPGFVTTRAREERVRIVETTASGRPFKGLALVNAGQRRSAQGAPQGVNPIVAALRLAPGVHHLVVQVIGTPVNTGASSKVLTVTVPYGATMVRR